MNDDQLSRIMASPRLPTLPRVAFRILELVQSPDVSIGELADTIAADPALATKILRTANSGLYGRVRGVSKLREAVMVLGLRNVKTLALGFSLVSDLSGRAGSGLDYSLFWRRSVVAACAARAASIAVESGEHDDEAFLGGLMHGLGVIAMDRSLGSSYAAIAGQLSNGFTALLAAEQAHIGTTHPHVGGMLARSWSLPSALVASIEHYADPSAAPAEHQTVAVCVELGAYGGDIATSSNAGAALSGFRDTAVRAGLSESRAARVLEDGLEQARILVHVFEGPDAEALDPGTILSRAHEALLDLSQDLVEETSRLATAQTALRQEAYLDGLTAIPNRRHFDEFLAQHVKDASARNSPLSMLLIDVDHFKRVNDTHGHPAGDAVLRALARALQGSIRGHDFLARYGGEEFVVVLPETALPGAQESAERIRRTLAALNIEVTPGKMLRVTVSVGAATLAHQVATPLDSLLASADAALYAAKRAGRNRVAAAA